MPAPAKSRFSRFAAPLLRAAALAALLGSLCASLTVAQAGEANRLAYLDENDPFYVSRSFPKLVTEQWVGEPGVQAVVILAVDDLRDKTDKWEKFLRPIIDHLKTIEGRAPISVMSNRI